MAEESPAQRPSPLPTRSPSPLPTRSPSPLPTRSPSPLPTRSPSPLPTRSPPPLPTKHYLLANPEKTWTFCTEQQEKWVSEFSKNAKYAPLMENFKKERTLNMVWNEEKLASSLSQGVNQKATFKVLEKIYYSDLPIPPNDTTGESLAGDAVEMSKQRQSCLALAQHMCALKLLINSKDEALTEDLVKKVHRTMMDGHKTADREAISGGVYREISVHAGNHVYPDFSCIPIQMPQLIANYNEKVADKHHDMYQLASWLLYQFVTLHPFEDGNGRMCRLLWCYSLMKDGLPFPLTISSGYSRAYKHYGKAIIDDRKQSRVGYPNLTALTVMSVSNAWQNFNTNVKFEL